MSEVTAYPQEGESRLPAEVHSGEIDTGTLVEKRKKQHDPLDGEDCPGAHEIKEQLAEGEDEVDFGSWNQGDKTLLQHCRESSLHEDQLLDVLHQHKTQLKANVPVDDVDSVDTEGFGAIHYLVTEDHENKQALLEHLVIHGASDVDLTTTKQGSTALHLAVEQNDLESAQTLVSLDADVNKENLRGNTPLDLANIRRNLHYTPNGDISLSRVRRGISNGQMFEKSNSVELVPATEESADTAKKVRELLLSVGAHAGRRNSLRNIVIKRKGAPKAKVAAMDKPVRSKVDTAEYRIVHDEIQGRVRDVSRPLSSNEAMLLLNTMIKHEEYRRKHGSRILCLDGGGVRGLIQMSVLQEIERRTKRKIVDLFDWIVGTSTGGIIALALSYGPTKSGCKTVRQLRDLYWSMKDSVFGSKAFLAKGNTKMLQEILQEWLGKDTTLSDSTHHKVLIPAVYKKDTNLELHFFNNCFDNAYSKELVWKVARYTSAAPFYFKEFENYIDGGMLANNPSEAALTVIQDFYHEKGEKIPISMVVSVGTGINPGTPLGKIDIKSNLFNVHAYLDLIEVLGAAVIGRQTDSSCAARCREQGIDYFRFDPELTQKVDSGEVDSLMLQEMIITSRKYLEKNKNVVDRLVERLSEPEPTWTR